MIFISKIRESWLSISCKVSHFYLYWRSFWSPYPLSAISDPRWIPDLDPCFLFCFGRQSRGHPGHSQKTFMDQNSHLGYYQDQINWFSPAISRMDNYFSSWVCSCPLSFAFDDSSFLFSTFSFITFPASVSVATPRLFRWAFHSRVVA